MRFSVRLTVGREVNRLKNLYRYVSGIFKVGKAVPKGTEKTKGCIVLVHIGTLPIPEYAVDCAKQIRLFSDIPVFFICSKNKAIDAGLSDICRIIYTEDIPVSERHLEFWKRLSSHRAVFDNFFQSALERFFVLYDVITYLGLEDVIHMENDILLYEDAKTLIRMMSGAYSDMTAPRMNEHDCMASVMYLKDDGCLEGFLKYINDHVYDRGCNDMNLLAGYMREKGLASLPVISRKYVDEHGLINGKGEEAPQNTVEEYYRYSDEFGGIFDAAPIGQFIGGADVKLGVVSSNKGFINKASYINPSYMNIVWDKTDKGYIPVFNSGEDRYRIYDLHIHCKELVKYRSDTLIAEKS